MFGPQLVVKHLTDILAAFFQICYAPSSKANNGLRNSAMDTDTE